MAASLRASLYKDKNKPISAFAIKINGRKIHVDKDIDLTSHQDLFDLLMALIGDETTAVRTRYHIVKVADKRYPSTHGNKELSALEAEIAKLKCIRDLITDLSQEGFKHPRLTQLLRDEKFIEGLTRYEQLEKIREQKRAAQPKTAAVEKKETAPCEYRFTLFNLGIIDIYTRQKIFPSDLLRLAKEMICINPENKIDVTRIVDKENVLTSKNPRLTVSQSRLAVFKAAHIILVHLGNSSFAEQAKALLISSKLNFKINLLRLQIAVHKQTSLRKEKKREVECFQAKKELQLLIKHDRQRLFVNPSIASQKKKVAPKLAPLVVNTRGIN